MQLEIDKIENGFVVRHDVDGEHEIYFRTINQVITYSKRILDKHRILQNVELKNGTT